jgi:hypothetical protein
MSDEDEYDSVADRQKAAQARVHTDLTNTCRERLAQITANPLRIPLSSLDAKGAIPDKIITQAINRTKENVGYSELEQLLSSLKKEQLQQSEAAQTFPTSTPRPSHDQRGSKDNIAGKNIPKHKHIIEKAERDTVLAYVENLLESCARSRSLDWKKTTINASNVEFDEQLSKTVKEINIALETEGVLWQLKKKRHAFHFQPIGSELMAEADEELSTIAQGSTWMNVISPYNAAYELYLERTYSYEIPEKLYNSIEELARTICVDLEGWEDNREQNLSVYLDRMREEGLFEPNNIMHAELGDLTKSMEKAFQKAGAERTNRHKEMNREYCTLLLHQTSAYLTFLIRSYESKHSNDSEE